ncbi:MAG: hypothetical protein ACLUS6_07225 [Dysosmobacter sp.]
MLKIERFARIEEELKKKAVWRFLLSQMLGCSEETRRRDLRELNPSESSTVSAAAHICPDKHDKTYASPLRKTLYQQEKARCPRRPWNLSMTGMYSFWTPAPPALRWQDFC